jgi:hypothetical protein
MDLRFQKGELQTRLLAGRRIARPNFRLGQWQWRQGRSGLT